MGKIQKDSRQKPMDFMLPPTTWEHPSELPDLRGHDLIAIDLETKDDGLARGLGSGWAYRAGHIAGVGMASDNLAVYAPITHPDGPTFDEDAVRRWVSDHMKHQSTRKVFHSAVYDLGWLRTEWDILPPEDGSINDTMIMAYLLDQDRLEYSLDGICRSYGVDGKDERLLRDAAEALGCDPKAEMWKMPARFVGPYGEQDCRATVKLARLLLPKLDAQDLMAAYRLECDLLAMIIEMRRRGIPINTDRAPEARSRLLQRRNMHLSELSQKLCIGRPIEFEDISSPRFLEGVFRQESVPYGKTSKGNPSFKTEEIEKIDHWLCEHIVAARKAHDAGEKFIGNYIMNFTHFGRIHAEAKSTRTKTTRFAYSDPPLQQMPGRNPEISKIIRGLFLPEDGEVWGALDYSQQEFRLMVHFAKICKMAGVDAAVQMYNDDPDTDFHNLAAQLTKLPRRKAKDVNFAKAFGAGKYKFALMTGMTVEEATSVMGQYDEELPFIYRLSEFCQNRANQRGYIRLLDGARRHFPNWEPRWLDWSDVEAAREKGHDPKLNPCSHDEAMNRVSDPDHPWRGRLNRSGTHKAMNSLIQGSAARQTKLCMLECWREKIVPMLQMHDELDFSFGRKEDAVRAQEIMTHTVKLIVPVKVDAEFGINWGEAKEIEDKETGQLLYDASFESAWKRMEEVNG